MPPKWIKVGLETLETAGRIVTAGFGDQVLVGIILELIEEVTPDDMYLFITQNIDLVGQTDDSGLAMARKLTGSLNLNEVTVDLVQKELKRNRIDLLSVIINTAGGVEWLEGQLEAAKNKLRG